MKSRHLLGSGVIVVSMLLADVATAECQGGSAAGRLSCAANNAFSQAATRQADDVAEAARRTAREADANALESKRLLDQASAQRQFDADAQAQRALEQTRLNDQAAQNAAAIAAQRRQATQNLEASSSTNQNLLNKQLASQDQMGQVGVPITGPNSPYRGAADAADQYGGHASQWEKRSSTSHTSPDGTTFETHWIQNSSTGQREQFKTKISE